MDKQANLAGVWKAVSAFGSNAYGGAKNLARSAMATKSSKYPKITDRLKSTWGKMAPAKKQAIKGVGLLGGGMAAGDLMFGGSEKESCAMRDGFFSVLEKNATWSQALKENAPMLLGAGALATSLGAYRAAKRGQQANAEFQQLATSEIQSNREAIASNIEADLKNEDMLLKELIRTRMAINQARQV